MNQHQGTLLHRDIKSTNCLVEALDYNLFGSPIGSPSHGAASSSAAAAGMVCPVLGRSKLADFGLAKIITASKAQRSSHNRVGTTAWMAPELILQRPLRYTEKSDVYSFGVVLWELITGLDPFADQQDVEIIGNFFRGASLEASPGNLFVQTSKPGDAERVAKYPPAFLQLAQLCLHHSPERRPSFEQIADSLRGLLSALEEEFTHSRSLQRSMSVADEVINGAGLSHAGHDPLSSASFGEENQIADVISLMKREASDSALQERGCDVLFRLARTSAENKVAIAALGGIQVILAAMNHHHSLAKVQFRACYALGSLALDDGNAHKIYLMAGVETILSAMQQHFSHPDVQKGGCFAFSHLADKANLVPMPGAVEAIIAAMTRYPSLPLLQEQGCCALYFLASSDDNRTQIPLLGGIEVILSAMKQHPSDADIQLFAFGALVKLCTDDGNKEKIRSLGGIIALVIALKQHPFDALIQECGRKLLCSIAMQSDLEIVITYMKATPSHCEVQESGCAELRSFAMDVANQTRIPLLGGIGALLSAMIQHVAHVKIQEHGCAALYHLARNNDSNKLMISSLGGVEAILSAMKQHVSHTEIQFHGCLALRSLSTSTSDQAKITSLDGIQTVLTAMTQHSSHPRIQEYGCAALLNLCVSPQNKADIARFGAVSLAHAALQAYPDDAKIQTYGNRRIAVLSE